MLNILKTKILPILWSLALVLIVFITVIDVFSFNLNYFEEMYQRNNTAEDLGMSPQDLEASTDVLLGYIKGKYETLDIVVSIDSTQQQMFNQKEKDHMVDVKDLYQMAITIRNISLVVWIVSGTLIAWRSLAYAGLYLFKGYQKTLLIIATLLAVVGLYAVLDFYGFWTAFHKVFFRNDLWLLNPATDRLVNLVPQNFFSGLVMQIMSAIIILLFSVYGGLWWWQKKQAKRFI